MASNERNALLMLLFLLLTIIKTADAFDGGDAAALLLGATVAIVGLCACLGWYARGRNGQF